MLCSVLRCTQQHRSLKVHRLPRVCDSAGSADSGQQGVEEIARQAQPQGNSHDDQLSALMSSLGAGPDSSHSSDAISGSGSGGDGGLGGLMQVHPQCSQTQSVPFQGLQQLFSVNAGICTLGCAVSGHSSLGNLPDAAYGSWMPKGSADHAKHCDNVVCADGKPADG